MSGRWLTEGGILAVAEDSFPNLFREAIVGFCIALTSCEDFIEAWNRGQHHA
jgi:hypothetical protein